MSALQPGDRVAVCGNPGRDPGEFSLRMLALERRADGLSIAGDIDFEDAQCAGQWPG